MYLPFLRSFLLHLLLLLSFLFTYPFSLSLIFLLPRFSSPLLHSTFIHPLFLAFMSISLSLWPFYSCTHFPLPCTTSPSLYPLSLLQAIHFYPPCTPFTPCTHFLFLVPLSPSLYPHSHFSSPHT